MTNNYPTVDDISVFDVGNQEWDTKSGGQLSVLFRLDYNTLCNFLKYDTVELKQIPEDIRGLRSYVVKNIPEGTVGGDEWHKVRTELVYVLAGSIKWKCTDLYGNTKEVIIDTSTAVMTPHHILHTYEALVAGSIVSVLTNTLYIPENPSTHDTYPRAEFEQLAMLLLS